MSIIMNIVDRFLKYVSYNTASEENTNKTPSTSGQMVLANFLASELKELGLNDVSLDDKGYLMATLEANFVDKIPTIGFIAHMDTSPDMTGEKIKPRIIKSYDGKDIKLNQEKNIILKPAIFPEILQYTGQDIIVTDGTTLLGADDKAGISEIVTAMEYLIAHPEIKHGKIRIAFTPDEEIGLGAAYFDVDRFSADWAYTMDGGEIGELEFENFNAASARIDFKGLNVHPGYAKNKMVNALQLANRFISQLPQNETPENTEGYEGFYHLVSMEGTVENASIKYIIRDHDHNRFENRKEKIQRLADQINDEYSQGTAAVVISDQYYNMREKIEPHMHIINLVSQSMKEIGIEPKIKPIRGGTDGAQLSYKGLPCPNIFSGGHNFHGKYEYLPIPSLEKASELIVKIVENLTKTSYQNKSNY